MDSHECDKLVVAAQRVDGEKYIFICDDTHVSRALALHQMGRFASRDDLNFTWMDAADASRALRQASRKSGRVF